MYSYHIYGISEIVYIVWLWDENKYIEIEIEIIFMWGHYDVIYVKTVKKKKKKNEKKQNLLFFDSKTFRNIWISPGLRQKVS